MVKEWVQKSPLPLPMLVPLKKALSMGQG